MNSGAESARTTSQPVAVVTALVVEPSLQDALSIVSTLEACRFHVTVADTFAKAKDRLSLRPPEVLVTEIRLADYNGLHLVLRGKSQRPDMAALVMSSVPDPVLQADGEAMGATFMLKPVDPKELAAAVFRTIFLQKSSTRPAGPIRAPFERRIAERRAVVVPISRDQRTGERRRDLSSLLRLVARNP